MQAIVIDIKSTKILQQNWIKFSVVSMSSIEKQNKTMNKLLFFALPVYDFGRTKEKC